MSVQKSVGKERSRCSVVLTGIIFEMNPHGQKRAADIALGRGALRLSRGRGWTRRSSGVKHRGGLELTRISGSVASSRGRHENVAMELDMLVSQKEKLYPATVTTTDGEEDGMVGNRLGGRRKERSVLL